MNASCWSVTSGKAGALARDSPENGTSPHRPQTHVEIDVRMLCEVLDGWLDDLTEIASKSSILATFHRPVCHVGSDSEQPTCPRSRRNGSGRGSASTSAAGPWNHGLLWAVTMSVIKTLPITPPK